jgi:hypothetical protein
MKGKAVDARRFDDVVTALYNRLDRRQLGRRAVGAKKRRKKKKKKKRSSNRCVTFGNQEITCDPGWQCCDPNASTVAACREPGYPVCCISSGFSHPAGSRCCSDYADGFEGFCPPDAPVCCSSNVGAGCCPAEYPVCCDYDCCTDDDFCDIDGYCFYGYAAREAGAEGNRSVSDRRKRIEAGAKGPRFGGAA